MAILWVYLAPRPFKEYPYRTVFVRISLLLSFFAGIASQMVYINDHEPLAVSNLYTGILAGIELPAIFVILWFRAPRRK
jgi:predicted membrane-bound spermidine synthase